MTTNIFKVHKTVELNGQQLNLYSCSTKEGHFFKCVEVSKVFHLGDPRRIVEKVAESHRLKPHPEATKGKDAAWFVDYEGLKKAVSTIRTKECKTLLNEINTATAAVTPPSENASIKPQLEIKPIKSIKELIVFLTKVSDVAKYANTIAQSDSNFNAGVFQDGIDECIKELSSYLVYRLCNNKGTILKDLAVANF